MSNPTVEELADQGAFVHTQRNGAFSARDWDRGRSKKKLITEDQHNIVEAMEAIHQEMWERTFWGYDRRLPDPPFDVKPEVETEWSDFVSTDAEFADNIEIKLLGK